MKKGVSLPITLLVIFFIAIVVLLSIGGMFLMGFKLSSSTTSLEAATIATCKKINPTICNNGKYDVKQPRMPVYDFDANGDGIINKFAPGPAPYISRYCEDDNLETLCGFHYGCDLPGKPFSSRCEYGGKILGWFIETEEEGQIWYNCCVKKVCGC